MNTLAEEYVKLILSIGAYSADVVDAYYGPKEWMEEASAKKLPLNELHAQSELLLKKISAVSVPAHDRMMMQRKTFLFAQTIAAKTKLEMMSGKIFSFDEEAKLLYNAAPPVFSEEHFKNLLAELERSLPAGSGSVQERYQNFRNQFIIPKEKLDTVFHAAIAECRKRTKEHLLLPADEHFTVEYVTQKAWSGYNWYKGNAHSLIQVNTDFPIFIDRAVDLAAHEGYPGHHVYNALLEEHLLRKRGWIEFSVYPLFSPQSLIAEGSANYGIDIVLPKNDRMAFEKQVLFPLAGLDSATTELYYHIQELAGKLSYAGNEAARGFLNNRMNKEQAIHWLVTYALFDSARAVQRLHFIEKYRSYVINYNYGQDLVKKYVEKNAGSNSSEKKRWTVFETLLSSPHTPGELEQQ